MATPSGDQAVTFNRKSADLIGRTIKEFRGLGRGELPLPKRRRGDIGGSASAAVAGNVAVASESIAEPTETTWGAVPDSVKNSAVEGDSIDDSAPCWLLGSGLGGLYQLVASFVEVEGENEVTGVYMVPLPSGDSETLYNMAGQVSPDVPLQVKSFTLKVGGSTTKINLVDVEKCG